MKPPDKKYAIAEYLLKELKRIHEEKTSGKMVKDEDLPVFRYKKDLVDYIFSNTRVKNSEDCELIDGKKNPLEVAVSVSVNTIRNAIDLLLEENLIHRVDGEYCYKPRLATNRKNFPILAIAKKIAITINVPESLLVLTVPSGFSENIANYLSAQFHEGDIIFIPLGTYILCIGVLPEDIIQGKCPEHLEETDTTSTEILRLRIMSVLSEFCCNYPSFTYREPYEIAYTSHYDPAMKEVLHQLAKETQETDIVGQVAGLTTVDYYAAYRNIFANQPRIKKASNKMKENNDDPQVDTEGVIPEITKDDVENFFDDRYDDLL